MEIVNRESDVDVAAMAARKIQDIIDGMSINAALAAVCTIFVIVADQYPDDFESVLGVLKKYYLRTLDQNRSC